LNHLQFSSIALASSFAGLRRFPEGRNFKQWTGDDSKALMKVNSSQVILSIQLRSLMNFKQVYLPAIEGHVSDEMVLKLPLLVTVPVVLNSDMLTLHVASTLTLPTPRDVINSTAMSLLHD